MSRPLSALFMEMLDYSDSYSNLSMRAVASRAQERGCDLVVAVGRRLDHKEPDARPHNFLYRMVLDRTVDALVVPHTIYQHLDEAGRLRFAGRLPVTRSAAISMPLGSIPRVWFQNEPGMRAVVRHLIHDHGKKKILFVTGTRGITEALVRQQVWEQEMGAAGLPHGSEWVIEGHFNHIYCPGISTEVAARVRSQGADAVVVSSDMVAMVLLAELPGLGLRVPQDVAVTGFDDIPMAETMEPGLTTVRQPIWDQFCQALDLALDGGGDKEVAGSLVIRESCGCPRVPEPGETIDTWRHRRAESLEIVRTLRSYVAELNLFAGQLAALDDLSGLGAFFDGWMPQLGFGDFVLSLACDGEGVPQAVRADEDPFGTSGPRWHRSWACRPGAAPDASVVFEASRLTPDAWWRSDRRRTVFALPLCQGNNWYGLLVVEGGAESFLLSRTVQELTASFLNRHHRLDQEVRHTHEARLRAGIAAEKTKTLGTLLAGFSHDLATPFSVGRDSTALLLQQMETLGKSLAEGKLTRDSLIRFFDDGIMLTRALDNHWHRAIELVDRFKRVGTEIPRDGLRTVAFGPFLADLLKTLQPMWRHRNVEVFLAVSGEVELQSRPTAFVDILSNLIQNALVHAYPQGQEGRIRVGAWAEGDRCFLEVADDGQGVSSEIRERIFEPYFTTKDGEGGTGLGLAIVRDRVQGLLAGRISCLPRDGGGTRFLVEFPRVLTE